MTPVVSAVARLLREVLGPLKKTPWCFIFGSEYLAMAHPAEFLWVLWVLFVSELTTPTTNCDHGEGLYSGK